MRPSGESVEFRRGHARPEPPGPLSKPRLEYYRGFVAQVLKLLGLSGTQIAQVMRTSTSTTDREIHDSTGIDLALYPDYPPR